MSDESKRFNPARFELIGSEEKLFTNTLTFLWGHRVVCVWRWRRSRHRAANFVP
jgi:hypothetical protein